MVELGALLFELSSDERLNIMRDVKKEKMKLSQISKKRDITATEASRHVQRLVEAKMITRDADGQYSLSPFGELNLSLLSGLVFTSKNRDYLNEHSLSYLPQEFVLRLGEVENAQLALDTMIGLRVSEVMYLEAEEYAWVLSDQVYLSATSIVRDKVRAGVKFRSIFPEEFRPPPGYTPSGGVERRTLSKIDVRVMVTEKEALVCFPYLNGKVDYTPFYGRDPDLHNWAKDLFLYFWEKASMKPSTYLK